MDISSYYRLLVILVVLLKLVRSDNGEDCDEDCAGNEGSQGNETRTRLLSRAKRFIVFPDGSSFQLVFCVQTMALIPIGDIFLYGNTAALAWNLPSDPKFFNMFKDHEKEINRRGDSNKNVYYLDDTGKVLAKVPYRRRLTVNPAFAKRSIDDKVTFREKLNMKIDRMKMHEKQSTREYLNKDHLDKDSVDFHRNSRVELYEKIEKLINALPKGTEFEEEYHRDYDKAHTGSDDLFCAQNQGYLQVGDIIWFGNTAALAWELSTDPQLFYLLKDHEKLHEETHRRNGISKNIYYLDESGKVLSKIPYHKRPIINPAFAKRSIEETNFNGKNLSMAIRQLHDAQKDINFLSSLDEDRITFHREGRKSLYVKLEKFLEG
ncbi:uncharacterized protein [Battus philenor]|uniref:uncharacterized protein n=1 Tax=Battus philenor TaxID=42288 RepID=UPI0035D1161E